MIGSCAKKMSPFLLLSPYFSFALRRRYLRYAKMAFCLSFLLFLLNMDHLLFLSLSFVIGFVLLLLSYDLAFELNPLVFILFPSVIILFYVFFRVLVIVLGNPSLISKPFIIS